MSRLSRFGVEFPFLVAPMVGISHVAFRDLVRSYIPDGVHPLLFTEMLSTKRLPNERLDLAEVPLVAIGESRIVPQLLGNDEHWISRSIERLSPLRPWGIDINMGCPATKLLAHNWGVGLLGDKTYAAEIVRATKRHATVPVSVKLRAGQGRHLDLDYLLDFTSALEDAGADWLTLHCRSQDQGHRGRARWDLVAEVARRRKIPVVANGDIQTWEDAAKLVDEDGVDGAMIARAATARPWILWQLAYRRGVRTRPRARWEEAPPFTPEEEGAEYFRAVLRYTCLVEHYYGDTDEARRRVIFFIAQGSRWLPFGHAVLSGATRTRGMVPLRDFLNEFAESHPQAMSARAQL